MSSNEPPEELVRYAQLMAKNLLTESAFAPKLIAVVEAHVVACCSPELSASEKAAKEKLRKLVRGLTEDERRMLAAFGKAMIGLAGYL
jgi:hypothetical protein